MKPMFEDPEMPADLRADLLRSRRAGEDYDTLAKLAQLRAAWAGASPPPPSEANAATPSGQHWPWPRLHVAPWAWKVALLATIAGASVYTTWPAARPAVTKPVTPTAAAAAPQAELPRAPEPDVIMPSGVEAPAPTLPMIQPPERSSRREIAQVLRIHALLERDPAAAYRLARRSEQEFQHGLLSEERQGLEVLALFKSGDRAAAEKKAQQFFTHYPESPMRELLETTLAR